MDRKMYEEMVSLRKRIDALILTQLRAATEEDLPYIREHSRVDAARTIALQTGTSVVDVMKKELRA